LTLHLARHVHHIVRFVKERLGDVSQGTTKFAWLQRPNEPTVERFQHLRRELVEVPAVPAI